MANNVETNMTVTSENGTPTTVFPRNCYYDCNRRRSLNLLLSVKPTKKKRRDNSATTPDSHRNLSSRMKDRMRYTSWKKRPGIGQRPRIVRNNLSSASLSSSLPPNNRHTKRIIALLVCLAILFATLIIIGVRHSKSVRSNIQFERYDQASMPQDEHDFKWSPAVYLRFVPKLLHVRAMNGSLIQVRPQEKSCGGTLIDKRIIVTSADCIPTKFEYVDDSYENSMKIITTNNYHNMSDCYAYINENDITNLFTNMRRSRIRRVSKYIIHPNYEPKTRANNIALLILNEPVRFGNTLWPASLAMSLMTSSSDSKHTRASALVMFSNIYQENGLIKSYRLMLVGWKTSPLSFDAKQLTRSMQIIYDGIICTMITYAFDGTTQICAANPVGQRSQYDPGSGLYMLDKEETTLNEPSIKYLVGIRSSIKDSYNSPIIIFTKIASYTDWIKECIKLNED